MHPDLHNALVAIKADTTIVQNGTAPSHSGSSGRSTPNNTDSAPGKLFVGGLSWQTSSEKLKEYFGMFGNVTDVLIMKDPVTQVSERQHNLIYINLTKLHFIFLTDFFFPPIFISLVVNRGAAVLDSLHSQSLLASKMFSKCQFIH